jgi:hypothetical protein
MTLTLNSEEKGERTWIFLDEHPRARIEWDFEEQREDKKMR